MVRRVRRKLFVLYLLLGVGLTSLSALYTSEFILPHSDAMICLYAEFHIPQKLVGNGFPLFWVSHVDGVDKIGCGPIIREFSEYSASWLGLSVDVVFYALCSSGFVWVSHKVKRNRLANSQQLSEQNKFSKFMSAYSGVVAATAFVSATLPLLARINQLQFSVVEGARGFYDIMNDKYLDLFEIVGYQVGKIHPQLPFLLWVATTLVVGVAVGITCYRVSKLLVKATK